jgi:hypothetical protein
MGRHYQRRRRVEFLDFMNRTVAQHPGKEIHVILDNLSTHKPKRDMWLARHPNVRFHYTSTHASFGSVRELIDHITSFIGSYNENAHTFIQKRLKPCFAVQ